MRRSSARSGPIANGISVDDDQEEQHADQRAAADAHREADVAQEQGRRARSCGASEPQLLGAVEPERAVGRRHDQPAAGEMLAASARRAVPWAATSSAVVGSSSSQIGRGAASRRASDSRRRCPADR